VRPGGCAAPLTSARPPPLPIPGPPRTPHKLVSRQPAGWAPWADDAAHARELAGLSNAAAMPAEQLTLKLPSPPEKAGQLEFGAKWFALASQDVVASHFDTLRTFDREPLATSADGERAAESLPRHSSRPFHRILTLPHIACLHPLTRAWPCLHPLTRAWPLPLLAPQPPWPPSHPLTSFVFPLCRPGFLARDARYLRAYVHARCHHEARGLKCRRRRATNIWLQALPRYGLAWRRVSGDALGTAKEVARSASA
jgi:hypothetical protein